MFVVPLTNIITINISSYDIKKLDKNNEKYRQLLLRYSSINTQFYIIYLLLFIILYYDLVLVHDFSKDS